MAEGENGAGDGAGTISLDTPGVRELLDQAVAAAVEPLKANRDTILNESKGFKAKLAEMEKTWGGLDPTNVKALMDRMSNDEETKLIAEGKIDEVISKRTGALKSDYETRLEAATGKLGEYEGGIKERDARIAQLTVGGEIAKAAQVLGVHPTAISDAEVRAMQVFKLNDKFQPEPRDANGTLLLGKNGKDPLTVAEWLEGMRKDAPHWFPGSSGTGSTGGQGGQGGAAFTISRADARDPAKYRQAKEAATKAGKELQMTD